MSDNLVSIELFGVLRERFGPCFRLAVRTPGEAIHALCSQIKGFREYLRENSEPGYAVLVGRESKTVEGLRDILGDGDSVQIVPAVAGAKSDAFNFIAGAVLTAVGYYLSFTPYAAFGQVLMNIGLAMAIGGVVGMLTPSPVLDTNQDQDKGPADSPSYSFSGPHLTIGQGRPVPILLGGPLRIGGAIISMGLSTGRWPYNGLGGAGDESTPSVAVGDGDTTPYVWAKKPD